MEQAHGISLENLVRLGTPMMHPTQLLDFMHSRVNKSQVVLAAIFDLLTSQCDRHAQVRGRGSAQETHPGHDELFPCLHDVRELLHAAVHCTPTPTLRCAQNIFLDEDGHVTLIDNERALYENHHCALDSILLPTTKKFAINVFENAWVNKFANWGNKASAAVSV